VVDLLSSLNVTMLPSRTRASHRPHVKPNHRAIASRPLNRSQSSAGNSASAGFARAAPVTADHPCPPPAVRFSVCHCVCVAVPLRKPSDSSYGMIGVPGGQPVALARRDSVNSAFDFWTVSAERLRMISLAKSSAPWRISRSASPSTPAICSLISAGVMAARPDRPYRSQFSTRRPSIRKNSRSLSVTTVRSNASA